MRNILIVDDVKINRDILKNILGAEYNVIEASDGEQAIATLKENYEQISAVLLDISMPILDGFGFLKIVKGEPKLSPIPVIVTTGQSENNQEIKALELGANDYITKPYNATIIRQRIKNTIALCETSATINELQRDRLTGLYSREAFFRNCEKKLSEAEPGEYALSCINIENFKIINDQYGAEKGDEVLIYVADRIKNYGLVADGLCCRVMADCFAVLAHSGHFTDKDIEVNVSQTLVPPSIGKTIKIRIGRYIITDTTLSANAMYDRATLAEQSIKNKYDKFVVSYDESLRDKLLLEQEIVGEMNYALKNGQFEAWFQPQYNHSTGAMVGAEALVRWRHPKKGLIPPFKFIPVFEQNGFIYELDKCVWEQACKFLRKWKDAGLTVLPVSVNVSRFDMLRVELVENICGLVEKYDLSPELLRLEITESAFAEATVRIVPIINELIAKGFTIEIDDFGSGYSSLNTLKEVPAQVLKLDMRFFENSGNSRRGGNIVESVIRMSKWIGMSVIAEGVEDKAQADFLKSIGCNYVQGYLYAKPMPADEYENLLKTAKKENKLDSLTTVENLNNDVFWDPKSMETLIFNSYVGGACIFEYRDGQVEVLRTNDKYLHELGLDEETEITNIKFDKLLDEKNYKISIKNVENSIKTNKESTCETCAYGKGGKGAQYVVSTVRVIARAGDRYLLYCSVMNNTARHVAEEKVSATAKQLQAVMDNVSCGITATVFEKGNKSIRYILANDRYFEILGYTKKQYEEEIGDSVSAAIYSEDVPRLTDIIKQVFASGINANAEYRVKCRDGSIKWMRSYISMTRFYGEEKRVQLATYTDITSQKLDEQKLRDTDEQLGFLNETAHRLLAQPDNNKGIDDTLKKLLAYFNSERAYVFEFNFVSKTADNTYEVCAENVVPQIDNLQNVKMEDMHFWINTFKERRYLHIRDVNALGEDRLAEKELLLAQGISSIIAVPLMRDGSLIGFVGIDNPKGEKSHVSRLVALGDYITVMLTRRDLTAKIVEDNLKLKTLVADIPGGFVRMRYHKNGAVEPIYFNDGFCNLVNMTREDLFKMYGENVMTGIPKDDLPIVKNFIKEVSEKGEAKSAQYRLLLGGGGFVKVMVYGRKTVNDRGEIFFNIFYVDVTGEEQVEEKRKELLDNFPSGAALYEYDGKSIVAVHINKKYWELVDRTPHDGSKIDIFKAVHPDDVPIIMQSIISAIRQKTLVVVDIRVAYGNKGDYKKFHVVGNIVEKGNGKYSIYASYTLNENRTTYQEALPIALTTIISSSEDISFVKGNDLGYICCSPSFAHMCGYESQKDVIGKNDEELFGKEYAQFCSKMEQEVISANKSRVDYEQVLPTKDGSVRYGSASKYPIVDQSGKVIGIYGVIRDITAYHNAYEQLKFLTDSILGGIASYTVTRNEVKLNYFNDGFCRLFGIDRDMYLKNMKDNVFFGIYEEDLPILREKIDRMIKNNEPISCVYRVASSNRGYKWINFRGVVSERHGDTVLVNAVIFDVTEIQNTLENLRVSEECNKLALQHSDSIIGRFSVADRTMEVPKSVAENFGTPEKMFDVPYGTVKEGLISPESVDSFITFYEKIFHGEKNGETVFKGRFDDGEWKWIEAKFSTIFSQSGDPVTAVISYLNVTDKLEKEAVYKKWQQSLDERKKGSYTLFRCNLSKSASFETMEGDLLNVKFIKGEFNFDERTKEYAEQFVYEDDKEAYINFLSADSLLAAYYRGKRSDFFEYREKCADGEYRWLKVSVELVEYPNSNDVEAYLLYENIDEKKRAELLTIELAETDPLTGQLNRTAFISRVEKKIKESKKNSQHAMLMIDVDGFKLVNDAFGHTVGDKTLIEIAQALRGSLRGSDYLCRLGGDEFLIFLCDIPSDSAIILKARHLCSLIKKSFSIEVQITGSIGISVWPNDGNDFKTLYEKADVALYHVKGSGKDNYAFYSDEMANDRFNLDRDVAEEYFKESVGEKRRMLIVDDNNIDTTMLANIFKGEFIIEKASDGASALIRLRHYGSAVSVVLLDLFMPGMDGFTVLGKMQVNQELRTIPVIVVSADDNSDTSLKAIRCGASDFVTKPVDPDLLRIRVYSAISKAENDRLRAKNTILETQNDSAFCYQSVMERRNIGLIEHDCIKGTFVYTSGISRVLAGRFNSRKLWQIFLSDMVADTATVKLLQQTEQSLRLTREKSEDTVSAKFKTPSGETHKFNVTLYKTTDENGLAVKIIFAFEDAEKESGEEV